MSCKKEISPTFGKDRHRTSRFTNDLSLIVIAFWQVERMVGYDDLYSLRRNRTKHLANDRKLTPANMPIFCSRGASRIDTYGGYFFIFIKWEKIVGNEVLKKSEWLRKARYRIPDGNIVITGHHDLGARKSEQKFSCGMILSSQSTLS